MNPDSRPRSGDTIPCGQTDQHDTHLYVAEGMTTPIACPGVDHTPDLPCERTDAHDPHPNAVHVGPGAGLADTHVNGHCPGRSAGDPPTNLRTVDKYCGATGNHQVHVMFPVFSPLTMFRCDGIDHRMSDEAYRRQAEQDPWFGRPVEVGDPWAARPTVNNPFTSRVDAWLAEHMRDTPSKAEVAELIAGNDRRLAALARQGFQADRASILNLRLQMVCDVLFGDESDPRRNAFEHALGLKYAEAIDTLEGNARKAQLASAGLPPSANIIIPGNPNPNGPTNGRRRK